jgi:hypothetical protein
MDVAVVRAVDYLSIKETLVGRVAQTEAKREWVDLHGPTDPRLFGLPWAHLSRASFFCRLDLPLPFIKIECLVV